MAERTERTHLLLTPAEQAEIDDWRFANRMGSRSEAIRALIRLGLKAHDD